MDCGTGESLDTPYSADSGDFECNICFDLANDPIVTLCGHLYCWPCLDRWLQVHSQCHECPVCKAVIKEERLVPIYGRGKPSFDPRKRSVPGGQRSLGTNYSSPFGNFTTLSSSLFGAIPSLFTLDVNGFHDATVYGATTGVPYRFSSPFHGGYGYGFYDAAPVDRMRFFLKMFFLIAGFLLICSLCL